MDQEREESDLEKQVLDGQTEGSELPAQTESRHPRIVASPPEACRIPLVCPDHSEQKMLLESPATFGLHRLSCAWRRLWVCGLDDRRARLAYTRL